MTLKGRIDEYRNKNIEILICKMSKILSEKDKTQKRLKVKS